MSCSARLLPARMVVRVGEISGHRGNMTVAIPHSQRSSIDDMLQPVRWSGKSVDLIDQTVLPAQYEILSCHTVDEVAEAIKSMKVRGAPAIGVTAGYGFALAAVQTTSRVDLEPSLENAYDTLVSARPTAVNLKWALDRMRRRYRHVAELELNEIKTVLESEAKLIHDEAFEADWALSELGARLLAGRTKILTHCNAGPLATAGYGTAVGVIRRLHAYNPDVSVLADETRPFLQGARLTAWELMKLNVPVTIITDSMAGAMMRSGEVDAIVTGADRIAANGDVANKIGTYSVAVLARAHNIPFYVAAPMSTVDFNTPDGGAIPIEERDPAEVLALADTRIAPDGAIARHPAFDVTPHDLVTAIITEKGVAVAPYVESLHSLAVSPA